MLVATLPEPVALLDILRERLPERVREAWTESDGVILSPKEPLRDGVAGFDRDTDSDADIVSVAVKELPQPATDDMVTVN